MQRTNTNRDFKAPRFNGVPNGLNLTVIAPRNHTLHSVWGI